MEEWTLLAQSTTTPTSENDPVELEMECPHPDQAEDIAQYMVAEIQTNALSEPARRMIENNTYDGQARLAEWLAETNRQNYAVQLLRHASKPNFYQTQSVLRAAAYGLWTEQVMQGAPWDHKPIIAARFPTNGNSTQFHHKYKKHEYYYDIWSNIHYGYMGAYCQFSESSMRDGAGLEQIGTDLLRGQTPQNREATNGAGLRRFDDTTDSLSVGIGFSLYSQYPNPSELTSDILLQHIENAPFPIQKGSKMVHRCFQ